MWGRGFFEYDGWLLDMAERIRHLPATIVHGRYDVVCPLSSAHALAERLPAARLVVIPDAGHSAWEPGTTRALVEAVREAAPRGGGKSGKRPRVV